MRKSIYLTEIPKEIKEKYKIIGRGVTSIVFEKDKHSVLMFIRDSIKTEWLTRNWGLNIGFFVDVIKSYRHPLSDISDINVIELPKLNKISKENKKKIKKYFDLLKDVNFINQDEIIKIAYEKLTSETYYDNIFKELLEFILNYDRNQYIVDLHFGNIMETEQGHPVLVDPVISKEMFYFATNRKI